MSTRSNIRPQAVVGTGSKPVVSGDMSADITSNPTILQSLTIGSYSYSWTGTAPVGEIFLQVSNDYALDAAGAVKNAGTWTNLTLTYNGSSVASVPLTGNTGNGLIDWSTGAYAIRTFYDRTSGVGTLQVVVNGKVS